jgi:hypothetical protein
LPSKRLQAERICRTLKQTKESNWKTQTAAMNAQGYVAGLGIPAPRERELKMCLD